MRKEWTLIMNEEEVTFYIGYRKKKVELGQLLVFFSLQKLAIVKLKLGQLGKIRN